VPAIAVAMATVAGGVVAATGAVEATPTLSAAAHVSATDPSTGPDLADRQSLLPPRPPAALTAAAAVPRHRGVPAAPRPPVRMLVVGDSVSRALAEGLKPIVGHYGVTLFDRGTNGCGISLGSPFRYFGQVTNDPPACHGWPQRWRHDVLRYDPDVAVLLVGRWELMDRVHNGRWMHIGQPAYDAYLLHELTRAMNVLSSHGARVVVVTAPYFRRGLRPDGGLWPEDVTKRVDRWNALVRRAAAHRPQVTVVDLNGKLGRGQYRAVVAGVRLRYDGVHLTPQAGRLVGPWLLRQVVAAAH
jgi:hypothetical protein